MISAKMKYSNIFASELSYCQQLNFFLSPEYFSCIHFLLHIIQTAIIMIGDNRLTLLFEYFQIVEIAAPEKEKLRVKNFIITMIFFSDRDGKSNRNGGFDYHDGVDVVLNHQLNHLAYNFCL